MQGSSTIYAVDLIHEIKLGDDDPCQLQHHRKSIIRV